MIKFKYNELKTTQVASLFLRKNNRKMNYMSLIKLLYLADREALARWERPLTGDSYFSMKQGPILSNVLDLINHGKLVYGDSCWYQHISEPVNYEISLESAPDDDELSKREVDLIQELFEEHKNKNPWEMVSYCHDSLKEWQHPGESSIPIRVEDILKELNKTDRDIEIIDEEISSLHYVQSVLSNN